MIEIDLPYPPSINNYYSRSARGVFLKKKGRDYRKAVVSALKTLGLEMFTGPVGIQIEIYPPDRRRRDIDNVLKALLDALEHGGAYENDSQIIRLEIDKREPVKGGATIVRIERRGQ